MQTIRAFDPLDRARVRFFSLIGTACVVLLAFAALEHARWMAYLTIPGVLWIAYQALDAADTLALRLLLFGALHGIGLLWWDWLLVGGSETLVYPHTGVFIIRSPIYMPFAWTITLTPIFILAATRARSLPRAIVVESLFYGVSEILAVRAGWWTYAGAPSIAGVPIAVLLAYPLFLTVSTRLAVSVARGEVGLGIAGARALAWATVATTVTWAVAVVPFR